MRNRFAKAGLEDVSVEEKTLYDEAVAAGRFVWSVKFFITSGRKPAGRGSSHL
jgi:hypothetical protein